MFNFFVEDNSRNGNSYYIEGHDFNHIKNVLRMHDGDTILVSENGMSHLCEIKSLDGDTCIAEIIEENFQNTDLPVEIHLFQALPKGDKMEFIIQKTVELGVDKIYPVEMKRCVVKLDDKKKKSKIQRWQSISESAAKQSKRCKIPEIGDVLSFKQAMEKVKEMDLFLVPFESKRGMLDTKDALSEIKSGMKIGIIIGPEGGFEDKEVEDAVAVGGKTVSLGSRILRTETAAMTSVGMVMLHVEMNVE
ncbi:MAG: 16S rRNA (uracil(1498)-N(3))-methyltransferase [Clostridia bacterium]|nr:16S rRNA (uracil(1498)-N(3))-methyltransferase [Clostridia bacterium]